MESNSDRALLAYLNSPHGQSLLKGSGITQADLAASSNTHSPDSKGIIDSLKKKALKKAWDSLPDKWTKPLEAAAKKGKGALKKAFNKLPKSVKSVLTVGGTIGLENLIDWLYDLIV